MVTRENRIFGLCIPVMLMLACGESALVQPDLISAKFQGADKKIDDLDILGSDLLGAAALPTDTSGLKTVQTSGSIFLGFSEFLNGNTVETVNFNSNKTVSGFTPKTGILEIACCNSKGANCSVCPNSAAFDITYRPDGGYVPPPDTPVNNFPPPAVRIKIDPGKPLPNDAVVVVYVMAGPIKNTENTSMAPVGTSRATSTPIAAAAWFKTVPGGQ